MQTAPNLFEIIGAGKIPATLVGAWAVMGLLLLFGFLARRALERTPEPLLPDEGVGLRTIGEFIAEWLDNFTQGVMEEHGARRFVPFFGSLFLFILVANFLGLVPGLEPPTNDSDLTFALALICFCFYIYWGLKRRGVAYLRSFVGPILLMAPLWLPIEVADNLFRPFSLGVRLAANMIADHTLLSIFTSFTYTRLLIPLFFYALGTIVCIVQALVFTALAISYVKMATAGEH